MIFARKTNYREIDQSISWLNMIINDCEVKISELETNKAEHGRLKRHRSNILKLANDYANDEFLSIDFNNQLEIIRQRYGVQYDRAERVREAAVKLGKKRFRERRNLQIARCYEAGVSVTEIAKERELSRQAVHTIINEHKKNPLF